MVNELLLIWRLKIMATCGQQMAAALAHWPPATRRPHGQHVDRISLHSLQVYRAQWAAELQAPQGFAFFLGSPFTSAHVWVSTMRMCSAVANVCLWIGNL